VRPQHDPADELAGVFARMSGILLTEQTVESALRLTTSLAGDTLAGSTGSGVTLMSAEGGRITSAATDSTVERLDSIQYEVDEGPCLDAWRDCAVVRSDDLSVEKRWPAWSSRASALGARSVLSVGLCIDDAPLGAIKVYSDTVDTYDEASEDLLHRFAAQAAIFVSNMQTVQAAKNLSGGLRETLMGRDAIAIARGVVMARKALDADSGYRHLMDLSRRARIPIRELAERIISEPHRFDID
jgi:transcriptional regulator with GAF, ATPase, and Fis domain